MLYEPLESRRLFASGHPLGVNFNDEALWDENFSTAVAQAKALGVTSVRIWLGFTSWSDRPQAWDAMPSFLSEVAKYNGDYSNSNIQTIRRAFELKREGFDVMVVVAPRSGLLPPSQQAVKDLITHFAGVKETPTGTQTLADVVDSWEIGNEPDLTSYWNSPLSTKSARIRSYVNDFLVPAAQVLRGLPSGETIVSAGPAFAPDDVNTILDELKVKNALPLIDYAGFHPYGDYVPGSGSNQQRDNILAAAAIGAKYGKELVATEWNTRANYDNPTRWAQAADENFRNYVSTQFHSAYYFALVNNAVTRVTGKARPAGLLRHDSTITSLAGQPWEAYEAWNKTPLLPSSPFYEMFLGWSQWLGNQPQLASISGVVWSETDADGVRESGESLLADRTVFIDLDRDGVLDTGEATAITNASGAFTLKNLLPGTYRVAIVRPSGYNATSPLSGYSEITVTAGQTVSGVDFGISTNAPLTPDQSLVEAETQTLTGGTTKSTGWMGYTGSGFADYAGQGSGVTYQLLRSASGTVTLGFRYANGSTANRPMQIFVNDVLVGTVACAPTSSWDKWSTASLSNVTLPAGSVTVRAVASTTTGGANVDSLSITSTTNPPPPATGSISGVAWTETDNDGIRETGETLLSGVIVYIDANNNGSLDSGETQTQTNASGAYSFSSLVGGTYRVRLVLPSGQTFGTPSTGSRNVALASGQTLSGADFATVSPVTPPPPDNTSTVLQAENATRSNGSAFSTGHAGYTGSGFVDYGGQGSAVLFTITRSASGTATLDFRYANGSTGNRPKQVFVNNVLVATLSFAPTGGWTTWKNASTTVTLPAGTVQIKLVASTTVGGANVDSLTVTSNTGGNTPSSQPGSIRGFTFLDVNKNGRYDAGDNLLSDKEVFLDYNGNGVRDSNEPRSITDSAGAFTFNGLVAGVYKVRRVVPSGYKLSTAWPDVNVDPGQSVTGVSIGTKLA